MANMLTVGETADRLRQSRYTIRNWIHNGRLPARRVGQKYLILESIVEEMTSLAAVTKLTRNESRRLRDELLVETAAAGVTSDTYERVMAARRERARAARDRATGLTDGCSS